MSSSSWSSWLSSTEEALERALRTNVAYVGLVASRIRAKSVVERLREAGLSDGQLSRLHVPAGIDIKARRGDEIALSIMAEIVQVRRTLETLLWGESPDGIAGEAKERASVGAPAVPATAVDPVCHMEVEIATASYTFEFGGTTYYFCCPGCRSRFSREPERHLVATRRPQ